jgi:hypothetical protein
MEIKTINLYTFSELPETVQEKLIKAEYDSSIDVLNDQVSEYFNEKAQERFGPDLKVYYSLGHCQGDGVAFEGEISLDTLLSDSSDYKDSFNRDELRLLNKCKDCISINVKNELRYYHYNSFRVDLVIGQYSYSRDYKYIDELQKSIEKKILTILQNISHDLEKSGYEDFSQVDEFSKDVLVNSDDLFTITGVSEDLI